MGYLETPPSLLSAIEAQVAQVRAPLHQQTKALAELFELFTRDRGRLGRFNYLDDPRYRLAYLRYHLPLNFARAVCALRDLRRLRPEVAAFESVVDLGAGPGSSTLATLLELPPAPRRYFLSDRSRGALRVARQLIDQCSEAAGRGPQDVVHRVQKLPELPEIPPGSLVWMSMVVNELRTASGRGLDLGHLVRRLEAKLAPPGVLVLVEPALREPGLGLLRLHDSLLASGRWRVIAPCTHQKDCPLLRARGRPWCHFHFDWRPGRVVEEIARPLQLSTGRSSLSYLALERTDGPEKTPAPERPRHARVIGDPMGVRGGGAGIYVCRDGRRETLHQGARRLGRGDRVELAKGGRSWRLVGAWGE